MNNVEHLESAKSFSMNFCWKVKIFDLSQNWDDIECVLLVYLSSHQRIVKRKYYKSALSLVNVLSENGIMLEKIPKF